eukprot:659968-Amphidinium_carterae.8
MKVEDESPLRQDVYLWDMVFRNYWDPPGREFAERPTVVVADSALHFTKGSKSSATNMAGQMKHSDKGSFEVCT